jgi:ribosomal protein S18 acetylase RimI-like enzyme
MQIKKAIRSQKSIVVSILCSSFSKDPQIQYIIGTNGNTIKKYVALMRYAFEYALLNGDVYITEDNNATALWKNYNSTKMNLHLLLESVRFFIAFGYSGIQRISKMEKLIKTKYPAATEFKYLWFIATTPIYQGKGHGNTLLQPIITKCKQLATPIYLETSTLSNMNYYQKKGFRVYENLEIAGAEKTIIFLMKNNFEN